MGTPGLKGEATKLREIASNMKDIFENVVIPYMDKCLLISLGLYVEPPPPPPPPIEEIQKDGDDDDVNNQDGGEDVDPKDNQVDNNNPSNTNNDLKNEESS